MILHLFVDEKFDDYAITHFEQVAPSQNVFLVIVPSQDYVLKYIQQKNKVQLMIDSDENVNKLMSDIYQYDAVIFHSLFLRFFLKIIYFADPNRIKLVWIMWGGEIYDQFLIRNKYLGKLTLIAYGRPFRYILSKGKNFVMDIIKKDKFSIPYNCWKLSHIVALKEELTNIQREWGGHAKLVQYSYYSIEKTVGPLMNEYVSGNNIFLGNSAFMTNNHLEAFQSLKKLDLEGRKIIVPLSYGDSVYRDDIVKRGKKLWGNDFIPLVTFMELEEYNRYIRDCNIVIMNHYRQQAIGNIVTALWLGAKLYMSKKSPVYRYLKGIGIIVYTVEKELNPKNPTVFTPLTLEEINKNRDILYNQFSLSTILKNTDLLVKDLTRKEPVRKTN